MKEATFEADISVLSGYAFVELSGYPAHFRGGVQTLGWWAEMKDASEEDVATLRMALVKDGAMMGFVDATLTATAEDGNYGKIAAVAFSTTGNNVVDALGPTDLDVDRWEAAKDTSKEHMLFAVIDGIDGESCTGVRVRYKDSRNI
ncbi:MAG: hypothetical protein ACX94C_11700 [Phycisphaerales bacterium]